MLYFITKKEFFAALDILKNDLLSSMNMGLKLIQDACVLNLLKDIPSGAVAEIGGGNSRTLPLLKAKKWQCWNIDKFEGVGNGPKRIPDFADITIIPTYIGDYSDKIPDNFFDVTYSISVIEHIQPHKFHDFFADIYRITKYGGISLHAIDYYLCDEQETRVTEHVKNLLEAVNMAQFQYIDKINHNMMYHFQCSYASNPDTMMYQWNITTPHLIELRERSQSVSLLLGLKKI